MQRFVAIGEVVKAIGLRGEVKLYPLLDCYEPLLASRFVVWQDGSEAQVIRYRPAGSCLALSINGINNRNDAEGLVGREIGFYAESYLDPEFPKPSGGLAFRYLGRDVQTTDGQMVGNVEEVRLAGGQLLLIIPGPEKEILIPAVEPILQTNEGLEGTLMIDPPEGLLDVQSS